MIIARRQAISRFSDALLLSFLALVVSGTPSFAAADPALAGGAADPTVEICAQLDIGGMGAEGLSELEERGAFRTWAELDDVLFACGDAELFDALSISRASLVGPQWSGLEASRLFVVRSPHPGKLAGAAGVGVLVRRGPWMVVAALDEEASAELGAGHWPKLPSAPEASEHEGCQRPRVMPLEGFLVLARQTANRQGSAKSLAGGGFSAAVGEAVEAVDGARWLADATTLAGWNRYTHGNEIDQARDWLVGQFEALGLTVSTPSFQVGGTTAYNVLATHDGPTRPDDWYLVGGHYDSISQNSNQSAPGAEDNASGCAGVLELARVVVPMDPEATIHFLCFSGEEQGLFGSEDHAGDLVAAGHASKVRLVLTMDMIGYTGDADLDVLLETNEEQEPVLDRFVDAAAAFTDLRTLTSTFAFGSDHVPYLNRDLPTLLTIENDWASYPGYHNTSDLPNQLTQAMGEGVVRMNAAVLAEGVGVTSMASIFGDGFESGLLDAWVVP